MDLVYSNRCFTQKSCNLHLLSASKFSGREDAHIRYGNSTSSAKLFLSCTGYRGYTSGKLRNSEKRDKIPSVDGNKTRVLVPTRSTVLQACTVTCGLIGALGVSIRQVSHMAAREGLPVADCCADITFAFESWHLGLIMGSVFLVSSSRFFLLKIWPDFAQSSQAANQQVLTSLEPVDYMIVAFLPGISEELLFRGSLLPLFGINWTSMSAVAVLFGVLHLGSGRNYSSAVWATLVGVVYGYTTVLSSSISVAMAAHALNNLVGAIIWRYSSNRTGTGY